MEEGWRPVKGYEGLYEVSNLGVVRSLDRWVEFDERFHDGSIQHIKYRRPGKLLTIATDSSKDEVVLSKNSKQDRRSVPELVVQTFLEIDKHVEVINIDGDRHNNRLDNLRVIDPTENLPDEIWKPVVGYEDRYEVSNLGRVRCLERMKLYHDSFNGHETTHLQHKFSSMLTQGESFDGYCTVSLTDSAGHSSSITVHRLVAKAFVSNTNEYNEVNHKDRDKHNNRAENLEWCTHAQNMSHAAATKIHKNDFPVRCIEDGKEFVCRAEASRFYGVSLGTVTGHLLDYGYKPIAPRCHLTFAILGGPFDPSSNKNELETYVQQTSVSQISTNV